MMISWAVFPVFLIFGFSAASTEDRLVIPVYSVFDDLVSELRKVLHDVDFHKVENPDTDQYLHNSSIAIIDYPKLGPLLYKLPNAKWVQGTWAGVEPLLPYYNKSHPVNFQLARYSGDNSGRMMGEYIISQIVNYERDLNKVHENQKNRIWGKEGKIHKYRPIYDLTVGILGLGNIGSRVGKYLHILGATVHGLGRKEKLPEGDDFSFVSKYYTHEKLAELLKECDYVINILPKTPETDHFLDNDVLRNCEAKGSVLINVGRGNVISDASLAKALQREWISGAILDVFEHEPLSNESSLWNLKNVIITPHVAVLTRAKDFAEYFKENFQIYQNKLPLPRLVDFDKGY